VSKQQLSSCFGLPVGVKFCKRCVFSNQKPSSTPEFLYSLNKEKTGLRIDEEGICDACRYAEIKNRNINWEEREKELLQLLDKYRRRDGNYDVLVPGSGGKDSVKAAHTLKYKYGMHPLTATWSPHIYTEVGLRNFRRWLEVGGFDNVSFNPNGRMHRLLTRLAVVNLFHPFQPFVLGQKILAPKIAIKFGIKLVFFGDNTAERGSPIGENYTPANLDKYYVVDKLDPSKIFLGGISIQRLVSEYRLKLNDLDSYLPLEAGKLIESGIDVQHLGYYLKWVPQENYYFAVEHTGLEANPERSEGTFTKCNSLDDKIDGLNYWTIFVKYGIGRATYDAAEEVRNHNITREEAVALVRRFDGEFPQKYFKEILEYMEMSEEEFFKISERFRSPHLWKKVNSKWELRKQVS